MGITERKERERTERQRLILDTAMKLFLEEGFEKVTMRRIAERIEYSPATIYSYFENKDEMLYTLYREGFEELYRRKEVVLAIKDPAERIRKHGEVYLAFALEKPELYDLMFIMRGPIKKIWEKNELEIGGRAFQLFLNNVEECMAAGVILGDSAEAAAFSLWSLVHGMASLIIRDRCMMFKEKEMSPLIERALNFILAGVIRKQE